MEKVEFVKDEWFTVGGLAEFYGISPRTLRHYHEVGLLVPSYVNVHTGYRYYSSSQLPRLEMILQMRAIGLSLKQIQDMLDTRNISMFEAVLNEQIDKLDEKIMEATAMRNSLYQQLSSCRYVRNPPQQDKIFIEFIPKRKAIIFDIEPYDLREEYENGSPWETVLNSVKLKLAETGHSLVPFNLNKVCCMISKENLEKNRLLVSGALIFVDEGNDVLPTQIIPSSLYACVYCQYIAMDNKSESEGLNKLLGYISENNYIITGPYLGEIVMETAVFDYMSQTILVKLQIPIRLKSEN